MSDKRAYAQLVNARRGQRQYEVRTWDAACNAWRTSAPMQWARARAYVGEANCPGERGGRCRNPAHTHLSTLTSR